MIVVPAHTHHHGHIHGSAPVVTDTAVASAPASTTATVTIQIAEGASLVVDGQTVAITGNSQTFNTPSLDSTRIYYYEMQARATRDGQPYVAKQRVAVRAGQTVNVDLRELRAETPANTTPTQPAKTEPADKTPVTSR